MSLCSSLSLFLLILAQICGLGDRPPLSFSECVRLERIAVDGMMSSKFVIAREGQQPAYLHCPQPRRQRRKDLKAAWTRLSDEALLAVGTSTFTMDPRFQVSKPRKNESDWVLILRRPRADDQGCYLCEMNTEPTSTLWPVYLKVSIDRNEVRREMTPQGDGMENKMHKFSTHLQTIIEGDSLLLNCTVEGDAAGGELPREVRWTKDGKAIEDGGRFSMVHHLANNGLSVLFSLRIRTPAREDSGLYACDGIRLVQSAQTINLVPPLASSALWTTLPEWVTVSTTFMTHLLCFIF